MAASHARGPGHVRQERLRVGSFHGQLVSPFLEPRQIPPGRFPQRGLRLAGQRQQTRLARLQGSVGQLQMPQSRGKRHLDRLPRPRRQGTPFIRSPVRAAILLNYEVSVRSGDAEAIDPGHPSAARTVRPVHGLRSDAQRHAIPVHRRVGIVEMQVLRDDAPPDHQRRLDEPDDPCSRLQMAHVRFHGSDQKRVAGVASPAVDAGYGVQLDRVADRGSGSVRLDVVHLQRIDPRLEQSVLHDLFQRGSVRHGQPDAGPPVVHHRAPDHRPDPVPVRLGVAQALEDHDAAALGANVAVRGGIEGLALPIGGQHHRVRAQLVDAPVEDGLHAARKGEVGLALLQIGDRVVDRHHRRGAGGVHRLGRAGQPEHERDAPGGPVQVRAAQRIQARRGLGGLGRIHHQHAVLVVADPGVDAGAALLEAIRVDARVFKRLPAHLQHHALLWIKKLGLHRGDPEKGVVEPVDVVDEGAETAALALDRIVAEYLAPAPLPGTGNPLDHSVSSGLQQVPEGFDIVCAGEPARHADDGDRLSGSGRRPGS